MRKLSKVRGFTLPEVLVTVTIVAVLAAVMVPAVINQVAKGDVPAVGQDADALRTAITTFAADTRRFPGRLSQLGKNALVATDTDFVGTAFDNAAISGYHGPYATSGAGHIGPTSALFSDSLKAGAATHSICMQDSTSNSSHTGTSNVSPSQMVQLDAALDHSDGKTAGLVQWTEVTNTGVTTVVAGTVRVCLATY
jgi:prepilin-type N-terminal cleavage/methylation domain-containing protein